MLAWEVFRKCGGQLRMMAVPNGMGTASRPIGLDYTAVIALAAAHDADGPLFFDCLPAVERIIVNGPDESETGDDEDC